MLLLQVHRRITARELARRLEVSERTIHRDMEALSAAGIPVFAERGSGGGWALLEEYRTNLTGLSRTEIQALFLTKPARLLADLGLDKASEAAFIKLLASLPSISRADAEYARQRIHVDSAGWHRSDESVAFLPAIQEAIWEERKLRFDYHRLGAPPAPRTVDPLGLVAKGSAWYLVAGIDGGTRTYRVSRMLCVELLREPFVRPKSFNLAAYWETSTAEFKQTLPSYRVKLRASPSVVPRLGLAGRFARIEEVGEQRDSRWVDVVIRFDVEEMAVEYVLSFGPHIEVIDPPDLCEKVVDMARRVIESYDLRKIPDISDATIINAETPAGPVQTPKEVA
jgi:predicted DNA-binding transcriptional regulator YafY